MHINGGANIISLLYAELLPHTCVGIDEINDEKLSLAEALKDPMRVQYYHDHLAFLNLAIK